MSDFPNTKDVLINPVSGDNTPSPSHIDQHADANNAIEAIQDKVGIDSSTDTSSLDYQVNNASSLPAHQHNLSSLNDVNDAAKADGFFVSWSASGSEHIYSSTTAPDASTTVKGVSKLSTAPAADPIAVGDNDTRVLTQAENDAISNGDTPTSTNLVLVESNLTGVIIPFAGSTAPTGWLLSYGQAVSRTTYAALFAVVSTTYGVGDGSTTFNLPDFRGNLPLGKDNMGGSSRNRVTHANADTLGGEEGAETHTLTEAEMPAHTHEVTAALASAGTVISTENAGADSNKTTSSTGGGGAHENMSPYMTLNYIIKT